MNPDLNREFISTLAERMRTRSLTPCSRWATNRRFMPDGTAYSVTDYPYVVDILNSRAKKNWVMKGAQTGLSEAAFTIAFYEADRHCQPVLYYFPTDKMAKVFSKSRFRDVVRYSPYLKGVVTTDSVDVKELSSGGRIYVAGSNSDASVRGISSGRLFFDELDIWPPKAQYQAEERASGRKDDDKIVWGFSTPEIPNNGIHRQYLQSTQEHFFFDCPYCKESIELLWEDSVEICGSSPEDPEVYNSYLKCSKCGGKLPHDDKHIWLASGRWVATNLEADPTIARGFWISQLYSPTVTPAELVQAYLRGYGDEDARKEFHNSKLGLPYLCDSAKVNDGQINDAMDKYTREDITLPYAKDEVVTLGMDQGGPIHHWVAISWTFEQIIGDPNDRAVGKIIGCGRILQDDWQAVHDLMRNYRVMRAVVDYFPEPTNARQFARAFRGAVYLCQYVKGAAVRDIRITEDDYGANLVRVDRVSWLEATLSRIRKGRLRFPLDLPGELREHIKAPVRTTRPNADGQYVAEFVNVGPDHYAHALNYAEIALKILDPSLQSDNMESIRGQ